jgi:hypothetical protein
MAGPYTPIKRQEVVKGRVRRLLYSTGTLQEKAKETLQLIFRVQT